MSLVVLFTPENPTLGNPPVVGVCSVAGNDARCGLASACGASTITGTSAWSTGLGDGRDVACDEVEREYLEDSECLVRPGL